MSQNIRPYGSFLQLDLKDKSVVVLVKIFDNQVDFISI